MNLTKSLVAAVGLGLVCAAACAQQPASAAGTGTVTGHVTCGDTQTPARFATAVLLEVPAKVTQRTKVDPDADETTQMVQAMAALGNIGKTNMFQVQTGVDGNYVLTDVAPGEYYLFATQAGYITPLNEVQAFVAAGVDISKPLAGVPVVHVAADHTANADVVMQRGAAISGKVVWDDGSPVTGATITILPVKGGKEDIPPQFSMLAMVSMMSGLLGVTDDLGNFRIASLSPGDYIISAQVKSGVQSGLGKGMNMNRLMAASPLVVYAPSAFHKADAKAVTLHTTEDLRDQIVTLKLDSLHTVSGQVSSLETRRGINSARVRLTDTQDKEFTRMAAVDAQGGFTLNFVPSGTYTMKVTDAEDTEPAKPDPKKKPNIFGEPAKTLRSYKDGTLNVVVLDKDVAGQNLELAVGTDSKKDADLGKLIESLGADDDTEKTPASSPK